METSPRKNNKPTQSDRVRLLLAARGVMRLSVLNAEGIAATTINRMIEEGAVIRLSRGLYQLAAADIDANHDIAEAAKRVSRGVICLTSVLAYHGLTDQIPGQVWMAIGHKGWAPREHGPRLRLIRMPDTLLRSDTEQVRIENVDVSLFTIPRTLVDCFRFRRSVGLSVAMEGLREALRQRKTTPAQIAELARARGVWSLVSPYLEAFTLDD